MLSDDAISVPSLFSPSLSTDLARHLFEVQMGLFAPILFSLKFNLDILKLDTSPSIHLLCFW